jgi:monothiol glutaredoxin
MARPLDPFALPHHMFPEPGDIPMTDQATLDAIDKAVKSNDVVLFMKGTPTFPQCGFSSVVVQILDYLGVEYVSTNVLEDQNVREGVKQYANWPTIPQLYVKGEFIGGCDILKEMFENGELRELMAEKGIELAD